MKFEWDPRKAARNLAKHGVPFTEALTVFGDPLARIFDDEEHSSERDKREIIVGHSIQGRLLLVCFTEREEDAVRIFAAWKATKRERSDYEENVRS